MSSVTEAITVALGKQGGDAFRGVRLTVWVPSKVLLNKESESERLSSL